jgi:hypothetical protein
VVKKTAFIFLGLLFVQRLVILLACPDLLHDWDAGELKHLDLALFGLPAGDGDFLDSVTRWLSAPENIHHGGYVVVSVLYAAASAVFGHSLFLLRCVPLLATTVAAACAWIFVRDRFDERAGLLLLALFVGAPPILLKWSLTARGGHTEAILVVPLLAMLCAAALRDDRPWRWGLAGLAGGFSVYFTYLAVPTVGLIGVASLLERARVSSGPGLRRAAGAAAVGVAVGFSPWLIGWLILDLPYLDATIHASARPDEASEVLGRGLLDLVRGAFVALPHNLWAWTIGTADAPAYLAEVPDQLDYTATPLEWAARAVINLAVGLGIVTAWRKRSPLLLAVCLLPAVHYLFVMRLANQGGWPEVPHRYLVIVWPAVAIAAAVGISSLRGLARMAGTAALMGVALSALTVTARWLGPPAPPIDIVALRDNAFGRIHASEAAEMSDLLARLDAQHPDHQQAARRGVGLVYSPIADYFLLFRSDRSRPYPGQLFDRPDPLAESPEARRALVDGALQATLLRGDPGLVCSWQPGSEFASTVTAALIAKGLGSGCP